MGFLDIDEKALGFEKANKLFQNIKKSLNRIGTIEYTLLRPSVIISEDEKYNSFEEMEAIIYSELSIYKKSNFILVFFKWMLIIFEAISSYLAVGLITHALNFESMIAKEWQFLVLILKFIFAIAFSYSIVNFAINAIKPINDIKQANIAKYVIAFGSILALPIFNVSMIYGISLNIEFKEIYLVSLFFTAFTGSLIVLKSKEISIKEEKRIEVLKKYKNLLKERKQLYSESRKLHIQIFTENNKYESVFEKEDAISESNKLYSGLRKYLIECVDFDDWANNYMIKKRTAESSMFSEKADNKR